jgi:hypothetical protein
MLQEVKPYKTAPFAHQAHFMDQHAQASAFFLSAEQGTGKTWMLINNMARLWDEGKIDACVVLAPNGVHTNWTLIEIPKHMPDWTRYHAVAWKAGMGKAATRKFETVFSTAEPRTLKILTMNWEGLDHARSFDVLDRFCQLFAGKLMFIGDEPSGSIKNPTSQRYKQLLKLKYTTAYRRMSDGTPITQGPFDAFAPYHFLDKRILATDSFMAFKAEYAEMMPAMVQGYDDNGQPKQVPNPLIKSIMDRAKTKRVPQIVMKGKDGIPRYRNLGKLQSLIAPFTYRVLKKDCLDLPEKIYKTAVFDMTAEQAKVYDKLLKECRLVFENNEAPVVKLAAITKLAQITSGFFIHPDHDEPVAIPGPNPKLELLVDRVEAIVRQDSKVIVWARFHAEIAAIGAALRGVGVPFVEYHGGVASKLREEAKIAFQEGDAAVMIAQQQAGGTGNTWTAAAYTIYFSNTFSLRERLQSEDRNHRIGQTESVVYLDLVARGTIDEKIVRALAAKKNVADLINGDGRDFLAEDRDVPF